MCNLCRSPSAASIGLPHHSLRAPHPRPQRCRLEQQLGPFAFSHTRTSHSWWLLPIPYCCLWRRRLLDSTSTRTCSDIQTSRLFARAAPSSHTAETTPTPNACLPGDEHHPYFRPPAEMMSTVNFGQPPSAAHARLSTSSSPQPSMSSSSESPANTPTFDTTGFSTADSLSEERVVSRDGSDEIVPKIEETELQLADVKPEPVGEETPISPTEPVRLRRRGRPRIHPPRSPTTASKQAKARSKTGCTTCRKRKKKCDETKPFCNCPTPPSLMIG